MNPLGESRVGALRMVQMGDGDGDVRAVVELRGGGPAAALTTRSDRVESSGASFLIGAELHSVRRQRSSSPGRTKVDATSRKRVESQVEGTTRHTGGSPGVGEGRAETVDVDGGCRGQRNGSLAGRRSAAAQH